jgi:ABC-type Fe3+ transport system permease subunit
VSATGSGVVSGIIFGLALVFLLQQLGFLSLSALASGLLYLVLFMVVMAILFGLLGNALGKRRARKLYPPAAPS